MCFIKEREVFLRMTKPFYISIFVEKIITCKTCQQMDNLCTSLYFLSLLSL